MMRGIRGAICVPENTREAIFEATTKLLKEVLERNDLKAEEMASMFLTATPDLNADFPAYAVRESGLTHVPVLCAVELDVPGAMKSLVRIMIHAETDKSQKEIHHVYLGEAARLRPDLAAEDKQ